MTALMDDALDAIPRQLSIAYKPTVQEPPPKEHRLAMFMIELPLDNRGAPGRDRDWVARSDCWAMREVVRMSCPVALLNFQFGALIARFMVETRRCRCIWKAPIAASM